jgi:mono/diheme cytochrome c family protein
VQALFEQRCSPCHVAGASGGLKLDSAAASYANLVRRSSRAEACGSRTLVAPGDPAGSYLLAKLRGDPEICGAPMPRNRPPLPAAELEALEAWVAGLPR